MSEQVEILIDVLTHTGSDVYIYLMSYMIYVSISRAIPRSFPFYPSLPFRVWRDSVQNNAARNISDSEINAGDTTWALAPAAVAGRFEEATIAHPGHVSTKFSVWNWNLSSQSNRSSFDFFFIDTDGTIYRYIYMYIYIFDYTWYIQLRCSMSLFIANILTISEKTLLYSENICKQSIWL